MKSVHKENHVCGTVSETDKHFSGETANNVLVSLVRLLVHAYGRMPEAANVNARPERKE
jgi:hypothetical protein